MSKIDVFQDKGNGVLSRTLKSLSLKYSVIKMKFAIFMQEHDMENSSEYGDVIWIVIQWLFVIQNDDQNGGFSRCRVSSYLLEMHKIY